MKRFVVLAVLIGCGPSAAMRAAKSGDRAALGVATHDLTNRQAASLALVVADYDLREAPAGEGTERVRAAWACAHQLDSALAARMKIHDEAGAAAALARLDGRGLENEDVRTYLGDPDPPWRAVGARSLVRPGDRPAREQALLDPDPRVRRSAARAARDAADPGDLEALADVARVDPEPIVRTEAVRAIAALSPWPSGRAANVLRDLWSSADDGLREDIAFAWAGPAVWTAGGREALGLIVASAHGPGAIEAAAAVLRRSDAGHEVAAEAGGLLQRTVEQGSRAERLQAIAETPLDRPELRQAVARSADDDDAEIRVAALARLADAESRTRSTGPLLAFELAGEPGHTQDATLAAKAVEKLEGLARPGSPVSARARLALASAEDRGVQAWIEQDLKSEHPFERLAAASALVSLHLGARAAPLLADVDPDVRVRAACILLVARQRW